MCTRNLTCIFSMISVSTVSLVVAFVSVTITIIYQVDTTQIMVLVITAICVVVIRIVGGAVSAGEVVRVTVGANHEAVSVSVVETVGFTSA